MIIRTINVWWKNNALIILVVVAILFLIGCWFMNNNSGTYDKYSFREFFDLFTTKSPQKPPQKKPVVTESKGEKECRRVLETYFKVPFPNARPDFLYNTVTKQNLELDCFNPHLKIACEYNGQQHYKYNKFMHNNRYERFQTQQYRDDMKRKICQKLGIKLIEVPYTVPIKDIEQFILNKLK